MNGKLYSEIFDLLISWGVNNSTTKILTVIAILIAIAIVSILADFITKKIILVVISKVVKKTKSTWDDILLEKKIFQRLSKIAPILIIYYTIGMAFPFNETVVTVIQKASMVYMLIVFITAFNAFFNAINEIYNVTIGEKKGTSIKSYIQVVKIIVFVIAAISALSILLNKEVGYFVTGLGAMTAVLLLVFKDSILGLVGGIQLTSNDMVRIGDWISMPGRNADGTVLEVSLNTVKVQNFDNTIATIPTYAMVSESFSNWRGMEDSEGRRIKRSIILDMKSVHFCSNELIEKLSHYKILSDYIESKTKELNEYNSKLNGDNSVEFNGRKLTNIGVFRKYIELYLRDNEAINKNMTLLIRQLSPTPEGIPMEIYTFSKIKAWVDFEAVQSDIFDHLLAVIPEFELSVFQNPTGDDFHKMLGN